MAPGTAQHPGFTPQHAPSFESTPKPRGCRLSGMGMGSIPPLRAPPQKKTNLTSHCLRRIGLSSHIVKYCESFIKEKILDESFGEIFTNFAMYYLFNDLPENEFVDKFINATNIVDMSKETPQTLTQKTILFFETVIEEHLQTIFDSIPADNVSETKNKTLEHSID